MEKNESTEYSSNMARKPAKNHPWRNSVLAPVAKWAAETMPETHVNNFKIGGGKAQK